MMPGSDTMNRTIQSSPFPANPKAVFFDWDGTLVDTLPLLRELYDRLQAYFGLPPFTDDAFFENIKYSAREIFPRLYGDRGDEAFQVWFKNVAACHLDKLTPLDGAEDVLKSLSAAGIPMGVVSNKNPPFLVKEIVRLGWGHYFTTTVGAGQAAHDKPAADPLLMALSRAGIEPGPDVLFIGDSEVDVLCGQNAGCSVAFIRHDGRYDGAVMPLKPNIVVDTTRDFAQSIKDLTY